MSLLENFVEFYKFKVLKYTIAQDEMKNKLYL